MKHPKDKKTLTFLICLACFPALKAQFNGIRTTNDGCDTSIVRYWHESVNIVFSKSPYEKYFLLTNPDSTMSKKFVTEIDVKDMEIVGDTLYYCGVNNNKEAIVGHFIISEMYNTDVFDLYAKFSIIVNYPDHYLYPKRLEVYHDAYCVHAVMVCDLVFPSDTVKKVMADCYSLHSSSSWTLAFFNHDDVMNERDNIFHPDDVAVTDNYVVFSGHKHCSAAIYMRVFQKPTFFTDIHTYSSTVTSLFSYSFWYYTNSANNYSVLGQNDGEHPVWCTHLTEDNIAIACMSENEVLTSPIYGSTIKTIKINAYPMAVTGDYFFPYSNVLNPEWNVRDLRYDKNLNNILMLYDADNPSDGTIENMTMTFNPSSLQRLSYYTNTKISQHSIDKCYNSPTIFSSCGGESVSHNNMYTYYYLYGSFNCVSSFIPILEQEASNGIRDFPIGLQKKQYQSTEDDLKRTIANVETVVFCE